MMKTYLAYPAFTLAVTFIAGTALVLTGQTSAAAAALNRGHPQTMLVSGPVSIRDLLVPRTDQIQIAQTNPLAQLWLQPLQYDPPPGTDTPDTDSGTGTRGGCQYRQERPPLASLVGQSHLMLTVSAQPTIWVYIPYSPEETATGTLSLQLADQELYRQEFEIAATPGIVGISLPETAAPLTVGATYEWFVEINCPTPNATDQSTEAAPAVLGGMVQRLAPSSALTHDLAQAQTPLDRIATYGRYHIWYDMLTELSRLRLQNPENPDLAWLWANLLGNPHTVGLAPYADLTPVNEIVLSNTTANFPPK